MIWKYWPLADLQNYISSIDSQLLGRLGNMLPVIEGYSYDPTSLMLKKNLVKIAMAFAPSDCFSKKPFMKSCLEKLPPEELAKLCNHTGTIAKSESFDARMEALLHRSWNDPLFSNAFIDFFSLPDHFRARRHFSTENVEKIEPPSERCPILISSPYKTLKDYQFDVFNQAIEKAKVPNSRFILQMPTGSGKTRTAVEVITSYINACQHSDIVVVWLAHSEELCEQAYQCFKEIWVHVAAKSLTMVRAWSGDKIPAGLEGPVFVVGSFQGLYSDLERGSIIFDSIRERIHLIIVDEAHKTIAPTYKQVVKSLNGDSSHIVGLTATPGRTIIEETRELAEFYFEDMIGITPKGTDSVITYLKRIKVLSDVEYEPLITGRNYELTEKQLKRLGAELDYPPEFLKQIAGDDLRNVEIFKRLLDECLSGSKVLFFGCSIQQSRFISALLGYFGIHSAHVDGTTDKRRRADVIDLFKKGNLQVLCNFGILSTGFDAPNTDTVFITRPTNSAVLYSQMIGRGMRGSAVGGTISCKIIDVIDNIIGYGDSDRVYRYFDEYWKPA